MTTHLVWDTTGILHASLAERVDVLGHHAAGPQDDPWRNVTTSIVVSELSSHGIAVPGWVEVEQETLGDVTSLSSWLDRVGSDGERHAGEASVLNMASSRGWTAVVDDGDAVGVGRRGGVTVHGTLWMIGQQVARGECAPQSASNLVDMLMDHEFRAPFLRGGYITWAQGHELF